MPPLIRITIIYFVAVAAAGSVTNNNANNAYGVLPCFCI